MLAGTATRASDTSDIDAFVNKFKLAVNEKKLESILAMNIWAGLPDWQQRSIEKSFSEIINQGVVNIKIEYIKNGSSIEFHRKGRVFAPNLPPIAKIYIEINTNKEFRGGHSYYIGKGNGELKFSHVVLR